MLVASILLWANLRAQRRYLGSMTIVVHGWPEVAYTEQNNGLMGAVAKDLNGFSWAGVGQNVLIALLILALLGASLEVLTRNCKRAKKPQRRFWQIHLSTAILALLVTGCVLGLNVSYYYHELEKIWGYGWPWVAYVPGLIPPTDFKALLVDFVVGIFHHRKCCCNDRNVFSPLDGS
jgi:hypothetical protein